MQKYECKNCGAELKWNPESNSLQCKYCDSKYSVNDFVDLTLTSEADSTKSLDKEYTSVGDTLEDGYVVYSCSHCGAEVVASEGTMATNCVYCGRAISITGKASGVHRPDKVLPYKITKEKAKELFLEYCDISPIAPKEFKKTHTIEKFQGLYVPFYIYSAHSDSSGLVESVKQTSVRRSGDDKILYYKTYEHDIKINANFKRIPIDASSKLDDNLMDTLEPFYYDNLSEFNPAYMAGFLAEQADVPKEELLGRVKRKIENAMNANILREVDQHNAVVTIKQSSHNIENIKQEYIMLPIWIMNVEHMDKKYLYAINGETGKVVGKLPISIKRLLKKCCIFYACFLPLAFFFSLLINFTLY